MNVDSLRFSQTYHFQDLVTEYKIVILTILKNDKDKHAKRSKLQMKDPTTKETAMPKQMN